MKKQNKFSIDKIEVSVNHVFCIFLFAFCCFNYTARANCTITGNTIICPGGSTNLCAPAGALTYLWSTGASTQCITVTAAGAYSVTYTDANGSSVCTQNVNVIVPNCIIKNDNFFCYGDSTQLCAEPGYASYLWSTGATTLCIYATAAGTYTLTVTNSYGCSSTCTKVVTVNPLPNCTITGGNFCYGGSTQLCGDPGLAGYQWSTGATTQCITVNAAGTYTLTVTNSSGCTSSCSKTIIVNQLPSCLISGNNFVCTGGSPVALCAPAGYASYLWSTGATTNCINVNLASIYTVTVTDGNGCTSSCSKSLTSPTPPACIITGSNFCTGSTTQLCAVAASSYAWSTGATTQCISVSNGGTYTVTVTDASGCSSSCSKTVTKYPLPDCKITGNGTFCHGGSTQLCGDPGLAGYLWSTGATTQCITVNAAGTYTLTVTNTNGCTKSCSKAITVKTLPNCSITGSNFCYGYSSQLCAPAGLAGYSWSTGATTQCIAVNTGGAYTVTVTNSNGCTSSCSKTVTAYGLPDCKITGNGTFCQGGSTQLCGDPGLAGYQWSTGATTQCITVNTAGTYTLTVSNSNGCTSSCSKPVTTYPLPDCKITGNGSFCYGGSTQLCGDPGLAGYQWSTGATTQCITVSVAGTYTLTVTDGNGCTSSCSKPVTTYPLPDCKITGNGSICYGSSTQLCGDPGLAGYQWSTGATTQCITVNAAGTYTLTVTNSSGCTSSCSKTIIVNQLPSCLISGNNFVCTGGSPVALCAPAGYASYLWSTGATTNCINVNLASIYTVTVTDGNGCTSSCSKSLTSPTPPACIITGSNFCTGSTTQLCAVAASSYAWSTGATTQCISVSNGGTYTVTVTDASGCSSSCSKTVTKYPLPDCKITGNGTFCHGGSTQLCGDPGLAGYLWSTGATTQCITVNAAGTYTLTVTNTNGCTKSCSKAITVKTLPNCSITGSNFCYGYSSQLCAPAGLAGYSWSTGATTQCIAVNTGGAYTVTVTNSNGCTSSCSKTVTAYGLPDCKITGNGTFCQGGSTQLCGDPGLAGYQWSTGATTQCITVNTAGTYTLTVSNSNGCTSSCSKPVTTYPLPDCKITGNGSFCYGGSTQLCGDPGLAGYQWSTGATTQCITVSVAGTYTLTVTDGNGCTSSCSKPVTTYPLPDCKITGNGSICYGSSTQLCGDPGLAGYQWSTGATTQCITVNAAGTYTLTVTNSNGCTSSCSKTIIVNQLPSCLISGNNFVCTGGSPVALCAPAGYASYLWSTGATTNCINVNLASIYTVTVTDGNGCTSSCSKSLTSPTPPACIITGSNFCTGSTTQLCAVAASSYAWSTGATTQCITVSSAGTYTVTITDASGCTSSCSKTVTKYPLPDCKITGNGTFCHGGSTQLCGDPGLAGYLWSTGATTQCITVNAAGTYTLTVTNTNGCTKSCSKAITVKTLPNCSITGSNFCYGYSSQLCAPAGLAGYSWSTGATTQCIAVNTGGAYTVTVTNSNGCTSSCSKTVTAYGLPDCKITGNGTFCQGGSTQLCGDPGLAGYQWSTGATTQCITVNTAGTYTLTVSNSNGCTSSCSKPVTTYPLPDCKITGNGSFCYGGSTQLCGDPGLAGYQWSTGATTQCITVSVAGTYTLTVTDGNGCTSSCSKPVTTYPLPDCKITGNGSICYGSSTQLCGDPGLAGYQWSTGATTQCITVSVAGTYTLTVTDGNGCTSSCSKPVTTYPLPDCKITGNGSICYGSSTQLCGDPGLAGYQWSTGATTQCITVNAAGTYTLTVTNSSGCTSSCSKTIIVNQLPSCLISGNNFVCTGGSPVALCAPAGYASYLWSTGATTNCINVNLASIYTVTVTDGNGCTSSCSKSLTSPTPPACIITGSNFCTGSTTQLCAVAASSYAWSTGATTQCISVSNGGTYTVTVTDASGCSSSCSKTVTKYPLPDCKITGNGTFCHGGSTQLCGDPGLAGYLWSTGATTQCITVNAAGTYTLTVTNTNGCTKSCSKAITVKTLPNCSITGSNFCYGYSSQLCAPAGLAGYSWSTGATTQCIAVNTGGAYTVTVTNSNGCTSSCSKTVTAYGLPDCKITGNGTFCQGGSTQLCGDPGLAGYQWSTGATTQCITVNTAGTYTLTVSNSNGCTSSCSKPVTTYPLPDCKITGNGSFCYGGSTQLCGDPGLAGYQWSTGATTQCITVSVAGTYTLTVTDGNGCTSSCSKPVTTYPLPDCKITGNGSICYGSSTQLCGDPGLAGYQWSTGATTQCITVNAAGTYTLTVTNSNGCTSSCSKTIIVNQLPSCLISGNNFVCTGGSPVALCAPAGYASYLWSTGATTNCINVNLASIYTVTVTDGNGCTSSCSKSLTSPTPPACIITGSNFCTGSTTQLCAVAASSYAWSTGATTQCITVSSAGTYTVTITDASGCTSSCSKTVTKYPLPDCKITGNGTFCHGGSTQLCGDPGLAGYLWSTGATTQCITVNAAGTYTLTVTNTNGCTKSCSKAITVKTLPNCSITGSNFCYGYSSQLCAPAGLAGYSWSTGATTQCIAVNTGGAYTVTVTNSNGCTSSCSKTVTAYGLPDCKITGNGTFCQGGSTQLCGDPGLAGYQWSTGATTQCITVNTAGTYTLTVSNSNGCTSSCSKPVTTYPLPDCKITGNGSFCYGGSTQLCGDPGLAGYQWSTGATTQCITVSVAGTYTLTVTDGNGCTSSCSKPVTTYPLPDCKITGNGSICYGSSTQLCGDPGLAGYQWSTGATTQCITVNAAGTYTLTVTNSSGCTSSCSKTIIVNQLPSCLISGNNFVCTGGSPVALCAPAGYASYLWSTGATTNCINVNLASTYTVTVTDANGCTSSCSKSLASPTPPACSITGSNFCQGSSSQLCAVAASSYAWSTGATTQCITVSSAGTYTVTITDASGCTSSCSKTVTKYPLPDCKITGNGTFCQGGSTQLCGDPGLAGYLWSTGATTQCITVNAAGTYTLTVTDGNGCTSSCSKSVTSYGLPDCKITGNGSICYGSSTQLCGDPGLAAYSWSTGATTQCITVNTAGTYTLTVTNSNGCTSSCSKTIIVNQLPSCLISGNNFVCTGGSPVALCAPAGYASYLWSTGATTNCINANIASTYTVTVTDANGCTSSCSKSLASPTPPACSITGSNFCQGSSSQLCAVAASSYAWSTGATTQCISVSNGGTYTVTVTDASGCSSSCSKTVTKYPLPDCKITGNGTFCQGGSTQLCGDPGLAGYLWSTGATTQCITVNAAGTYTLTVTNTNGCTKSCSKAITVKTLPNCSITGSNFCYGYSSQLCAPAGLAGYSWSTGATTQCIAVNTGGAYTVTVTNSNGCTSSCSKTVTAYGLPDCKITGNGTFCQGGSTQLCGDPGLAGYQWSTGATTQCITVNTAGTYTLTVSNSNGCTSSCSKPVTTYPLPDCKITGNGSFCYGGSTQLCGDPGLAGYQWSTGATTQCITVSVAGTYTLTVTDGNGCTSSCSKPVTTYPLPDCKITGNGSICYGSSTQLCGDPGLAGYQWSTGATTQCITVNAAGTYTLTVTNSSGCTSSCSKTIIVNQLPSCLISGNNFVCTGGSPVALCAPAGYASYLWSTGATTNCINANIASTYTVTVTDANGCTSSCSKSLASPTPPACSITGSNFCQGSSSQLCAVAASSYAWSTGATTQCITVSSAGTYTVTITDASGCTSSCSKTVTKYPLPDCKITGNGTFCQGGSTQLCGDPGLAGYLWSTGATTQCITVNAAGTYTLTVTDGNGCTSSCSKPVTTYPLPDCKITGNGSICYGSSTQLCGDPGLAGYQWSTGATTQCITVNAAGTYTLTVTNSSGCTSSCSKTIIVNQLPSCLISGNNFVCTGGSPVALCAPAGYASYLWSTGATTNCINVNLASIYTVTVTDGNGCTSSCSKSLTSPTPPACIITGSNFCTGSTTQLCAVAASSYAWSTGATTQCISVSNGGTYTVTVTDASGCSSSCSKTVTKYPLPDCKITGNGTFCQGGSTQLCGDPGYSSYLWNNGATTQCIIIGTAGTYTLTVTNANGCSKTCTKTITVNTTPSCLISGNSSICQGGSTQLCAPAGYTYYLWSTGATTQCITVTTAGTRTVTVTNSSGCISSCSKTVTVGTIPSCLISGNTSICSGGSTQLCAPSGAGYTYLWNNGATTQCRTVSAAGYYTVTVTNSSGCTSSCSKCVTTSTPPPCSITGNSNCAGTAVQLCAPSGSGYTYLWNNGAATQCRTVTSSGYYTVTVTNSSGCSSSCSKNIICSTLPSCSITGNSSICSGGSTQLCAPSGTGYTYLWNNGATTKCRTIFSAGTYTVTVTNSGGCSSSCSKKVTVSSVPSCTITGNCNPKYGSSTSLCAPAGIGYTYLWNNGATTKCRTVSSGGYYTVTVTNSSGCSSSCKVCVVYSHRDGASDDNSVLTDGGSIETKAYPNPFSSTATIEFRNTESNSHVVVELYNLTGEKITTLFDSNIDKGVVYKTECNADGLADGVYVYRIINGNQIINRKLILIK